MGIDKTIGPEGRSKFLTEWLSLKVPGYKCAFCGKTAAETEFGMHDHVSFVPNRKDDSSIDLQRGFGLIPLTCKHCGFVHFFSAQKIGIVIRDE